MQGDLNAGVLAAADKSPELLVTLANHAETPKEVHKILEEGALEISRFYSKIADFVRADESDVSPMDIDAMADSFERFVKRYGELALSRYDIFPDLTPSITGQKAESAFAELLEMVGGYDTELRIQKDYIRRINRWKRNSDRRGCIKVVENVVNDQRHRYILSNKCDFPLSVAVWRETTYSDGFVKETVGTLPIRANETLNHSSANFTRTPFKSIKAHTRSCPQPHFDDGGFTERPNTENFDSLRCKAPSLDGSIAALGRGFRGLSTRLRDSHPSQ